MKKKTIIIMSSVCGGIISLAIILAVIFMVLPSKNEEENKNINFTLY